MQNASDVIKVQLSSQMNVRTGTRNPLSSGIVAGMAKPTRGKLLFNGKKVETPGAAHGIVFQQDAVFPWLTLRDTIEIGLHMKKLTRKEMTERCGHWINHMDLTGREDAYPKEFSGGMCKRADLARSIQTGPEVMLMDDPFGAFDQQTESTMQRELLHLSEASRSTVLFVTHDLEEAVFLSDEIVVPAPKPGRVKALMTVDLPRPRNEGMRISNGFLGNKRELHALLVE